MFENIESQTDDGQMRDARPVSLVNYILYELINKPSTQVN